MAKEVLRKPLTDSEVKRKAVKLVVVHIKKKITKEFIGIEHVNEWISEMEELLASEDFKLVEYIRMRRDLNDIIERIIDEENRFKLRDSWYSLGKASEKRVKMK